MQEKDTTSKHFMTSKGVFVNPMASKPVGPEGQSPIVNDVMKDAMKGHIGRSGHNKQYSHLDHDTRPREKEYYGRSGYSGYDITKAQLERTLNKERQIHSPIDTGVGSVVVVRGENYMVVSVNKIWWRELLSFIGVGSRVRITLRKI